MNDQWRGGANPNEPSSGGKIDLEDLKFVMQRKYRLFLDKISPYPNQRWAALGVILVHFLFRVYLTQGYAVVTYLLGLFYLNQVMLYLSPAEDPEDDYNNDNEFILPVRQFDPIVLQQFRENDEFKGFQRKLYELELWKLLFNGTLICTFLTFFEYFDFPIFWPLLLFYFIFMTTFLCRYKIQHMIKYKYIPFEFGKKQYGKSKIYGKQ